MRPLTEDEIRGSFVNATDDELRTLALPLDYLLIEWDHLDFLGWRDPRAPRRGYIITQREDDWVGVVLRAAESSMSHRHSAYCNLCRTLQPADQVSLFTARRAGGDGAHGNTVGTYICADLSCPENVRLGAPLAPGEVRSWNQVDARIDDLTRRTDAFVASVLAA
jgi:hypothetical protein